VDRWQCEEDARAKRFYINFGRKSMLPFALTCAAPVEVTWNAESVKVVVTYPQSAYADHISLLKVGGE